ncbi:MAG: alpha/beta hydrolase [Caldilineaceae bacterium]|nr:alpha/beta hydrolase [Caldilineaceae bacterium]
MPYAKAGDVSIYYEVHGESGTPMILIGGYGGDIAGWSPEFVEKLATEHRVILFDNRGTGHSDKPDIPYSMKMFAADTVAVLDALEIEQAHVLGVSMGGMIAQHIGLNYPERVRSLILACTTAAAVEATHGVPPTPEIMEELTKPPVSDRAEHIRNGWRFNFTERFITTHADFLERRLQAKLNYPALPPHTQHRQFQAIVTTHDTYDRLPELQCPVLIQVGSEDRLLPPVNSRIIASRIPQARLIEYTDVGHGFIEEATEQVTADMLSFMREVEGIRSQVEDRQTSPV